jgi:hypothetical protein
MARRLAHGPKMDQDLNSFAKESGVGKQRWIEAALVLDYAPDQKIFTGGITRQQAAAAQLWSFVPRDVFLGGLLHSTGKERPQLWAWGKLVLRGQHNAAAATQALSNHASK